VAITQTDGTIKLDFGSLPRDKDEIYNAVLLLSSKSSSTVNVNLALSGPVAKLVKRLGYWEGGRGIQTSDLSLKKGATEQLAFELDAPAGTTQGERQGTLTITAKPAKGHSQQNQLSVSADVVDHSTSPSPSPSCSPSPSVKPKVTTSPSARPSASATPSPSVTPSMSVSPSASPSVSPQPSTSPSVAAPSASTSATIGVFLVPISLVTIGLAAFKRRKRST
jgi:hypothetical protein